MAVGNILRLAGPFTGSGTTSLPFGFKVFYPTDVYVAVANNDAETPSNLTYGTNYSVVINDDQDATPGGTVTLVAPLEVNQIAVVGSAIPYTQETQMTNYNRFPPEIINTALDRIVIQIQQLVAQLNRVVKVPETSSSTPEQLISNLFTARNEAVEASQRAEAAATTSKTYAGKVLAFKSAIEAVSNYLAEVQTVAEKINDVVTVSADMDNVRTVAGDHNAINALVQNIKYVRAVSDIVENVVKVATNVTSVQLAAAHREQIDIVAGGIASVKTVADGIDSVTALANKLAELVTIVSHLAAVDTVSADIASVVKVADGIKEVVAAGASIANINLVAADLANVDTVAGRIEDVSAIAGRLVDLLAAPGQIDTKRDAALKAVASAQESAVQTVQNTAATETSKAQTAIAGVASSGVSAVNEAKSDALAKIDATVTQAKSDIQAQVTAATTQATTATQAATTATQKASEADQSAKDAEALKTAAETAKANAEASATTATEQAGIATEKAEALTEAVDTLTALSNDAVRFTAQEKTDAEKYQARKNIAASSAGEVEALKKQVANLQAQAEGKTFTYETDATEAYAKDVPEGAYPYAAVKNFGGKTIVWNQEGRYEIATIDPCWNPLAHFASSSSVSIGITAGENSGASYRLGTRMRASHKMYVFFDISTDADNTLALYLNFGGTVENTGIILQKSKSVHVSRLMTYPATPEYTNFYIYPGGVPSSTSITQNITVSNFCIFDLTRMFGAGNEPTKEEFEAMFPENYYEYNAGELKSAPVNNLKVVGRNLYPESGVLPAEIKEVFVTDSDGDYVISFDVKDFSVLQTTASVVSAVKNNVKLHTVPTMLKKESGVNITANEVVRPASYTGRLFAEFKGLTKGMGIFFYLNPTSYAQVNGEVSKVCIEKTNELRAYTPYKESNLPIPDAVKALEGYGWSAGTAKNWVDWEKKEYHREVAKLDVSKDCTIRLIDAYGNNKRFGLAPKTKIPNPYYPKPQQVGAPIEASAVYTIDNPFIATSDYISVHATSGGSLDLYFTSAANGSALTSIADANNYIKTINQVIYYKLAEPEIIDISDILPDDNLIEVEEGGTITFENSNGDGFRIPVPSEIVYQKKVTTNE